MNHSETMDGCKFNSSCFNCVIKDCPHERDFPAKEKLYFKVEFTFSIPRNNYPPKMELDKILEIEKESIKNTELRNFNFDLEML